MALSWCATAGRRWPSVQARAARHGAARQCWRRVRRQRRLRRVLGPSLTAWRGRRRRF